MQCSQDNQNLLRNLGLRVRPQSVQLKNTNQTKDLSRAEHASKKEQCHQRDDQILTLDAAIPSITSESRSASACDVMHSGRANGICSTLKNDACIDAGSSVAYFRCSTVSICSTLRLGSD